MRTRNPAADKPSQKPVLTITSRPTAMTFCRVLNAVGLQLPFHLDQVVRLHLGKERCLPQATIFKHRAGIGLNLNTQNEQPRCSNAGHIDRPPQFHLLAFRFTLQAGRDNGAISRDETMHVNEIADREVGQINVVESRAVINPDGQKAGAGYPLWVPADRRAAGSHRAGVRPASIFGVG